MSLSRFRSTAPGLWSRISTPNHLLYGSSEENESSNFRSLPSPSSALIFPSSSRFRSSRLFGSVSGWDLRNRLRLGFRFRVGSRFDVLCLLSIDDAS